MQEEDDVWHVYNLLGKCVGMGTGRKVELFSLSVLIVAFVSQLWI